MPVTIYPKSQQAIGQFDGGAIKENKPIGFPHEGGSLRPFSSLFYWAHAWSDGGGLIGEHPHRGFEIMSFVLEGEIEHYDSQLQGWKKLKAGDVQIIRSGNGIYHAERFLPGAHIFQIWVDPDLGKTLQKEASYNDYQSATFPQIKEGSISTKILKGNKAPLTMDAMIKNIYDRHYTQGNYTIDLTVNSIHCFYLIDGEMELNGALIKKDDFFVITSEDTVAVNALSNSRLFMLEVPEKLPYKTYAEMHGMVRSI